MTHRSRITLLAPALLIAGCVSEEQARESLASDGMTDVVLTETRSSWNSGEWSFTARDPIGRDCTGIVQVDWSPGGGDWGAESDCALPTDPERLAAICTSGALPDACAFAARSYRDGEGAPADATRSFTLAATGCAAGSAASCFYEGYAHIHAAGTPLDEEAALRCYRAACDGGEQAACDNLGDLLLAGGDQVGALAAYDRGCGIGSARSCHERAAVILLQHAERPAAEVAEAAALEVRECEAAAVSTWQAEACNNAGYVLEHGVGVAVELGRANVLYQRGCDAGSAMACLSLGNLMYAAVPPQTVPALATFRRACEGRNAVGCRNVGVVLRDGGEGVARDADAARAMFEQACALGDVPSCEEARR